MNTILVMNRLDAGEAWMHCRQCGVKLHSFDGTQDDCIDCPTQNECDVEIKPKRPEQPIKIHRYQAVDDGKASMWYSFVKDEYYGVHSCMNNDNRPDEKVVVVAGFFKSRSEGVLRYKRLFIQKTNCKQYLTHKPIT